MAKKNRNPLEPMATSVNTVLAFLAAVVALGVVGLFTGSGGSFFGIGSPIACAEVFSGVPIRSDVDLVSGTLPGVQANPRTVSLCADDPTGGQQALNVLTGLPSSLAFAGALLIAAWLIRSARKEGIFTERTAGRLRLLGWFVLAGQVVATLLESLGRFWLAGTMLRDPLPDMQWLNEWDMPFVALLVGAVFISMARIMRLSTAMREDLEGTV